MVIQRKILLLLLCMVFLIVFGNYSFYPAVFRNIGFVILTQAYFNENQSFSQLHSRFTSANEYFKIANRYGCGPICDQALEKSKLTADNLIYIGKHFDSTNDLSRMFQWYEFAITTGDHVSDGLYYRGYSLNWRPPSGISDSGKALEVLLSALKQDDFSSSGLKAETLYRIASLHCNYISHSPEICIPYYKQAVVINPSHAFAWMELGRQHFRQWADLPKAKMLLKKAIAVSDSFEIKWAHFHLGEIYQEAGQTDLARQEYETALKTDAHFSQAVVALQGLN